MGRWQPNPVERLQAAAMKLFFERGYDHVTIADIAEHAGLTTRTFFNHFSDKREVLFAGASALEENALRYLGDVDNKVAPIDAAVTALIHAGNDLAHYRDFALLRRNVISSTPDLQERGLTKMASLVSAMTTGLESRGVPHDKAQLVSHAAVTIFMISYDEWTDNPTTNFSAIMRRILVSLREAIDVSPIISDEFQY